MTTALPPEPELRAAHVVVVGAGGLGCPAAWALAEAGVGRLTVVDPDVVEPSNLPRQVLYEAADVGRPKALVAAERLAGLGARVEGLDVRLDDTTEDRILDGAAVLVDATDGAPTKDWLNAAAVRRAVPLVHAAALRSEGRLLEVPAGGRPCLACLFGRLTEEPGGSCADLGVWGGVVGAVGFLAAHAALCRLAAPAAPSSGYVVLDVEGGRAFTLGAEAAPGCPVCGRTASLEPEPYPREVACEALDVAAPVPPFARAATVLDLVDEVCPLNLLRARRAVEALDPGSTLAIHLGAEGATSVPDGLRALGHEVLEATPHGAGLHLRVRRGARIRSDAPLTRDQLLRFARQVVLPEVGEAGQRRLLEGEAVIRGCGEVAETAAVYLAAAGVGHVVRDGAAADPGVVVRPGGSGGAGAVQLRITPDDGDEGRLGVARVAVPAVTDDVAPASPASPRSPAALDRWPGPIARALGALLADAACRALVEGSGKGEPPRVVLGRDGTIGSRSSAASLT